MSKLSIKSAATTDLSKSKRLLSNPVKMSPLNVLIDDDLLARFKSKITLARGTIKSAITEMIEKYLEE